MDFLYLSLHVKLNKLQTFESGLLSQKALLGREFFKCRLCRVGQSTHKPLKTGCPNKPSKQTKLQFSRGLSTLDPAAHTARAGLFSHGVHLHSAQTILRGQLLHDCDVQLKPSFGAHWHADNRSTHSAFTGGDWLLDIFNSEHVLQASGSTGSGNKPKTHLNSHVPPTIH